MIKKMYVITVARAFGGDDRPADAFGYCLGIFSKKKKAFEKLKADVDDFINELKAGCEEEEDRAELESSLRVYDNLDDGWSIEVDYEALDGTLVEVYYRVEEMDVEVA